MYIKKRGDCGCLIDLMLPICIKAEHWGMHTQQEVRSTCRSTLYSSRRPAAVSEPDACKLRPLRLPRAPDCLSQSCGLAAGLGADAESALVLAGLLLNVLDIGCMAGKLCPSAGFRAVTSG